MLHSPNDPKKTLRQQYPELDVQAFKDLTKAEEDMIWLYSSKSSPFAEIKNPEEKIKKVLDLMKKDGTVLKESDREKYLALQFTSQQKSAMEVMRKFNPELRSRAASAGDQIFNNLIAITSIDINDYATKTDENGVKILDATTLNNYTSAVQKCMDLLPQVIKMNEEGFGINKTMSSDIAAGKSPMEVFLERERYKDKK